MSRTPVSFRARSRQTLRLHSQRSALMHTTAVIAARRRAGIAAESDWLELTARSQAARRQTLSHLGTYLQQLESALLARGGQVFWARTSAEACQFIVDLARRSGSGHVLQTRSALPLEIGLAEALQRSALTLSFTNQGEFLAALGGQRPAHPNAGAAHLRIDDIVRTLHARLDMPVFLNADAASHVIRGRVRQVALQSSLAVMGVDLAVAETGVLALFNDQGDVRLAAALAPVQVAIMGLEQIVPTLEDLWLLQRVHATSASGRATTTYVELLSGAATAGREFHLSLLDNGRSRLLNTPGAELLSCIHCGACLDVCPVARRVGSQPYAWSYPGPLGAAMAPLLLPAPFGDVADASTLCGACRSVCPVGIDLPRHLLAARDRSGFTVGRATGQWFVRMLHTPGHFATLSAINRLGRLLVGAQHSRRWLAPWLWRWTAGRDLPAPAPETFRRRWARQHAPAAEGAPHV